MPGPQSWKTGLCKPCLLTKPFERFVFLRKCSVAARSWEKFIWPEKVISLCKAADTVLETFCDENVNPRYMPRNLPRLSNSPELARIMLTTFADLGGASPEQRVSQG